MTPTEFEKALVAHGIVDSRNQAARVSVLLKRHHEILTPEILTAEFEWLKRNRGYVKQADDLELRKEWLTKSGRLKRSQLHKAKFAHKKMLERKAEKRERKRLAEKSVRFYDLTTSPVEANPTREIKALDAGHSHNPLEGECDDGRRPS